MKLHARFWAIEEFLTSAERCERCYLKAEAVQADLAISLNQVTNTFKLLSPSRAGLVDTQRT